jgi:hypothetical protein
LFQFTIRLLIASELIYDFQYYLWKQITIVTAFQREIRIHSPYLSPKRGGIDEL